MNGLNLCACQACATLKNRTLEQLPEHSGLVKLVVKLCKTIVARDSNIDFEFRRSHQYFGEDDPLVDCQGGQLLPAIRAICRELRVKFNVVGHRPEYYHILVPKEEGRFALLKERAVQLAFRWWPDLVAPGFTWIEYKEMLETIHRDCRRRAAASNDAGMSPAEQSQRQLLLRLIDEAQPILLPEYPVVYKYKWPIEGAEASALLSPRVPGSPASGRLRYGDLVFTNGGGVFAVVQVRSLRGFSSQAALYNQRRSELRTQASSCLAAFAAQHQDAVAVLAATYTDTEGLIWLDDKRAKTMGSACSDPMMIAALSTLRLPQRGAAASPQGAAAPAAGGAPAAQPPRSGSSPRGAGAALPLRPAPAAGRERGGQAVHDAASDDMDDFLLATVHEGDEGEAERDRRASDANAAAAAVAATNAASGGSGSSAPGGGLRLEALPGICGVQPDDSPPMLSARLGIDTSGILKAPLPAMCGAGAETASHKFSPGALKESAGADASAAAARPLDDDDAYRTAKCFFLGNFQGRDGAAEAEAAAPRPGVETVSMTPRRFTDSPQDGLRSHSLADVPRGFGRWALSRSQSPAHRAASPAARAPSPVGRAATLTPRERDAMPAAGAVAGRPPLPGERSGSKPPPRGAPSGASAAGSEPAERAASAVDRTSSKSISTPRGRSPSARRGASPLRHPSPGFYTQQFSSYKALGLDKFNIAPPAKAAAPAAATAANGSASGPESRPLQLRRSGSGSLSVDAHVWEPQRTPGAPTVLVTTVSEDAPAAPEPAAAAANGGSRAAGAAAAAPLPQPPRQSPRGASPGYGVLPASLQKGGGASPCGATARRATSPATVRPLQQRSPATDAAPAAKASKSSDPASHVLSEAQNGLQPQAPPRGVFGQETFTVRELFEIMVAAVLALALAYFAAREPRPAAARNGAGRSPATPPVVLRQVSGVEYKQRYRTARQE